MALTKTTTYDKIEILSNGVIQVRISLKAFDDDGSFIGERYQRYVLVPGQDITNQPTRLQKICNAVWTAQVIADYQAEVAANQGI